MKSRIHPRRSSLILRSAIMTTSIAYALSFQTIKRHACRRRSRAFFSTAVEPEFYHQPVMVHECIDALIGCSSNKLKFLDGTLGGGGHSLALLEKLRGGDVVYGCDVDSDALRAASRRLERYMRKDPFLPEFIPIQSNFRNVHSTLMQKGYCEEGGGCLDGILLDLGVSSYQIDTPQRGFAFMEDGPLDMRMNTDDTASSLTAAHICNEFSESDLVDVFQRYGDESPRRARSIARSILRERPLLSTQDLVSAISSCGVVPKFSKRSKRNGLNATCARIFQSLRMVVNREDAALEQAFMEMAPLLIKPGGRLVVLTYHSIEDRMAKNVMKHGGVTKKFYERDLYGNEIGAERPWKMVGKKKAEEEEVGLNSRARSATLRVAQRL